MSRRAESEQKAELLSHEFGAEAEHIMPNNPIARAMAAAQSEAENGRKVSRLKAEEIFQVLQEEANL